MALQYVQRALLPANNMAAHSNPPSIRLSRKTHTRTLALQATKARLRALDLVGAYAEFYAGAIVSADASTSSRSSEASQVLELSHETTILTRCFSKALINACQYSVSVRDAYGHCVSHRRLKSMSGALTD